MFEDLVTATEKARIEGKIGKVYHGLQMIHWLDEDSTPEFPPTELALTEPNGLLAAGGRMNIDWLYKAYSSGIFPWYSEGEPRLWWSPAPRAVITPETFRIPRSVRKLLNKKPFQVTTNLCFQQVIESCQQNRLEGGDDTWINDAMTQEYTRLHNCGLAISVECWNKVGALVGGFYGVRIAQAFFGESMFSEQSGASKVAFATAAPLFFKQGIQLVDCQMHTEHMGQFGIQTLKRSEFESKLKAALENNQVEPLRLPTLLRTAD